MLITLTISGNSSSQIISPPCIELKGDYVCGLISFDTYHSIPNVDIENNLFHIGNQTYEIPVGLYEINDLSNFISDKYTENNKGVGTLNIRANYNTLQTEIKSTEKIYFHKNHTIGSLLGFSKRQLDVKIKYNSDQSINLTKINTLSLNCNIVSGSYINNTSAHILHQFALIVSPGYKINETPANVIYLPVNTATIHTLVLKVTDQHDDLENGVILCLYKNVPDWKTRLLDW